MTPQFAAALAWSAWAISWSAAAFWSTPAAKRPARREEWLYRALTVVGVILIFAVYGRADSEKMWETGLYADWALFGAVVAGLMFTWWARLFLGRLWSSSVTRKAEHHVVDTGPYAIVRHPIYTGLIVAAAATAVQEATFPGSAGLFFFICGLWVKARLEERFLREQLGADAYDSYRRRVPMLLPFWPKPA